MSISLSDGIPEDEDDEFVPLEVMPTLRLNDVVRNLNKPTNAVVNLDALIPATPKELSFDVLRTLLYKIRPEVKTLSIRFNQLSQDSIEYLIDWIAVNDHLETFYAMGCGIDDKMRQKLEDAWKKNLCNHRTQNLGYTFIRITAEKEQEGKNAE